ncbi:exodeoxyribonuclease V subunit beta [Ramlibacter tataouinensis]|uniref:exodeoxyribonuclease V subunit beta n=1 Tax=Ramlibacter tataouinensis TaxID=94132 RepID=UPI0022F3BC64|nr:exodeoxyribonuclease V subunit beta [Ramlibacter tataouinensis]WBY02822.1 exodeoxyribonuclease V subunit beta [Ramlibacter tataouinensis]
MNRRIASRAGEQEAGGPGEQGAFDFGEPVARDPGEQAGRDPGKQGASHVREQGGRHPGESRDPSPDHRTATPEPLDVFACPLDGVRLIEASAGTGKTWNICGLYLRLLLRRQRPLTVQQILVVTFTKAATAELRDRIRQRIADVLAALEGRAGDFHDAFLPRLRASLEIAEPEAAQRLAQALRTFDEAAIHTIHGFCQRALEDTPFTAGLPLRQEMLEDDSELREQAARDFWRRHVAQPGLAPGLAAWLLACKDSPARFADLLQRHAAKPLSRIEWPQPAGGPAVALADVQQAYDELRALWQAERSAVLECVEASRASLHKTTWQPDNVAAAAAGWDAAFAAGRVMACLQLGDKARLLSESKFQPKKNHPPCREHAFFGAAESFLLLWDRFQAGLQEARIELLQRLLQEGGQGLRELKRQRRAVAFDDMLSNLHRRLVPAAEGQEAAAGALAQQLRERYPAALIDEFQDTDPLQFGIFRAVYGGQPETTLFLVGDPKQAIYSFRNADLHTYLQARAAAQAEYTLAHNQRSSAALIRALNGLFGRNPRAFMLQDLDYHPVSAGDKPRKPFEDGSGQPRAPLQLWSLPLQDGEPVLKAPAQLAVAQACASEIARLLAAREAVRHGGQPLEAGDIAVLVRSHAEGSRIRAELARLNVGSVELAQASVFGSVDAQELEDVLRAVLQPNRQGLLLNALATGLLGVNAPELQALAQDSLRLPERAARLAGYKAAWLRRGIGPMLRELMAGEGVEPRMLARADGERRLTNLRHLAECLHEAAREHASPEALLRWLQRQRREGGDAEATQVRLESDRNLVKILTIHKSKGLEFTVVFCPFLWDGSPGGGNRDLPGCEYHGDDHRHVIDYREADAAAKARIQAEKDAERLRLIYVALTRAVHRCYLVVGGYLRASGRGSSPKECSGNPLNWLAAGAGIAPQAWRETNLPLADVVRAWERLAAEHPHDVAIEPLPPAAGVPLPPPTLEPGRLSALPAPPLPATWRLGSYSGLVRGAEHDRAAVDHDLLAARREAGRAARERLPDDDILRFPSGAREGTCLHAVFEHAHFDDPASWPRAVEAALRRHPPARAAGREAPPHAAMVQRMLGDVLHTPLGQGFALAQLARARTRAEFAFNLASHGLDSRRLDALLRGHGYGGPELPWQQLEGYLHGAIDLVYEHGGRWWILDWKSNHLGWDPRDYEPAALRQAMDDNGYHLQLVLYTLAVHRWLQRRLPGYGYDTHFGGVHYLFVRGVRPDWCSADGRPLGVHFDRPPPALVQALEAMLGQPRGITP